FQVMFCAVFGLAVANPPVPHSVGRSEDVHADIPLRSDDVHADGFDSSLRTFNGTELAASGDVNGNIHGYFRYIASETVYQLPEVWIPTTAPMPPAVAKAIAWLESHPTQPSPMNNPPDSQLLTAETSSQP
ncbi:larval cuticle protein 1-like, partial [Drosophila santomea]|uniref:larval cuticle protein 1-like n=1 Tax=Drosophila santomea TaxID=129105 RepID=UPI0019540B33